MTDDEIPKNYCGKNDRVIEMKVEMNEQKLFNDYQKFAKIGTSDMNIRYRNGINIEKNISMKLNLK